MIPQKNQNYYNISANQTESIAAAKTFISNVFSWMFLGLLATAGTAYFFSGSDSLMSLLVSPTGMTMLGWIVMLSPLGFVLIMSFGFNKLSAGTLTLLFIVFSILMGMSLSFIFLAYTIGSITTTFAVTSGMFGVMALLGYTTKTDLTKFGSILIMGLVGIIIASFVNWFVGSSQLDYIISFIGVLIFTGLTAYDVQKLKRIGNSVDMAGETAHKLTILGAVTLYLDFINLFLFLLRFLGNRR